MSILLFLIILLALIVVIGILNEKFFHLQSDIALIMFSLVISAGLLVVSKILNIESLDSFVEGLGDFGFENYF